MNFFVEFDSDVSFYSSPIEVVQVYDFGVSYHFTTVHAVQMWERNISVAFFLFVVCQWSGAQLLYHIISVYWNHPQNVDKRRNLHSKLQARSHTHAHAQYTNTISRYYGNMVLRK